MLAAILCDEIVFTDGSLHLQVLLTEHAQSWDHDY